MGVPGGQGACSWGRGDGLTTPELDSPVAYFSWRLNTLNAAANIAVNDLSVPGTVAIQMVFDHPNPGYFQAMRDKGILPKVLVIAYGMNDGMPSAYNSGQTFNGFV